LIDIRLLGGVKNAVGRSTLVLDKEVASISEILSFLRSNVRDSNFDGDNILLTINGAESSMLSADESIVKTGDDVRIVTIVHGG
jgi:molybdopterin converting factor small subunit